MIVRYPKTSHENLFRHPSTQGTESILRTYRQSISKGEDGIKFHLIIYKTVDGISSILEGHSRLHNQLRVEEMEFLHRLTITQASLIGIINVVGSLQIDDALPAQADKMLYHEIRINIIIHHHLRHFNPYGMRS